MRLIFDMVFKSILSGVQQLLLRRRVIGPKTYFCGFLHFSIHWRYCHIVTGI